MTPLAALAAALEAEGGLVAGAVRTPTAEDEAAATHGALAASGPRAAGREAEVALVVEAVREGYDLHYGTGRVVRTSDADLALLAGDRLYALGLERLAAAGDLGSVAALADLIALGAQARAQDDLDRAEAAWTAGAVHVGWGEHPELASAREQALRGEPGAADALRAAARHVAGNVALAHGSDGSAAARAE